MRVNTTLVFAFILSVLMGQVCAQSNSTNGSQKLTIVTPDGQITFNSSQALELYIKENLSKKNTSIDKQVQEQPAPFPKTSSSSAGSSFFSSNWMWIIMGSLVLALSAVIAAIIFFRKKKTISLLETTAEKTSADLLIEDGEKLIEEGKIEEAREMYKRLKSEYDPEQDNNGSAYKRILAFYNNLSSSHL